MAESGIPLRRLPETQEEIDEFAAELKKRIEHTNVVIKEMEKAQRVTQKDMQISFCNCGGRCGRGARG